MKRQIRRGVFETNSSSCHSLTMCTQSDYDRWKYGELIYDYWDGKLISIDELDDDYEEGRYYTYDRFNDYECFNFETYEHDFTTESGDTVVAFGYYGHD